MRKFSYFTILIGLLIPGLFFSCKDDGKIAAALEDGRQISQGDPVPFLLLRNRPEPSDGSTDIYFNVNTTTRIIGQIYSEDWVLVLNHLEDEFSPGSYQFRADIDERFSSGEYYYVMTGGEVTQIRKLLVVR